MGAHLGRTLTPTTIMKHGTSLGGSCTGGSTDTMKRLTHLTSCSAGRNGMNNVDWSGVLKSHMKQDSTRFQSPHQMALMDSLSAAVHGETVSMEQQVNPLFGQTSKRKPRNPSSTLSRAVAAERRGDWGGLWRGSTTSSRKWLGIRSAVHRFTSYTECSREERTKGVSMRALYAVASLPLIICRSLIVIGSIGIFGAVSELMASDAIWDAVIPRVCFTNVPAASVMKYIEQESRRVDPAGRGVRILFNTNWFGCGRSTVDWRDRSLRWIITEGIGRRSAIIDDVALVFDVAAVPTHRMAAVFGVCHDADTGLPIRNMTIRTAWEDGPRTSGTVVDEEGAFVGYVTYIFARPWLDGVGCLHDNKFETINVFAEAPGYQRQVFEIFVGDQKGGAYQQRLDVRLRKEEGTFLGWLLRSYHALDQHRRTIHAIWGLLTIVLVGILGWQHSQLRRKVLPTEV
jgi:hypothetical protein